MTNRDLWLQIRAVLGKRTAERPMSRVELRERVGGTSQQFDDVMALAHDQWAIDGYRRLGYYLGPNFDWVYPSTPF